MEEEEGEIFLAGCDLGPDTANNELREDSSKELREDSSVELRE